jgi:hypothetical protein
VTGRRVGFSAPPAVRDGPVCGCCPMRPVGEALRLAVGDRQRLTVMSALDAIGGAEAVVRNHSGLRDSPMTRHTIARIDLGVGRPAEIEASALVDFAPLDVLHVDMMPMPAAAARRLAEALTAAADRLQEQQSSRNDATWT